MNMKKRVIYVLLLIWLAIPAAGKDIPCIWENVEQIVAVADIHGDYDNFVRILKGVNLVDDRLNWSGGETHLVQTGDVMDRGPNARKAFDLLKKLELQAPKSGGRVHVLIGNHEEANLTGIAFDYPGYVTPEQFASFLPKAYRKSREKSIRRKYKKDDPPEKPLKQAINEYWHEVMQTDIQARRAYLENFYDKYGKWLLKKNVVIKINDIIFAHGGISLEYSTMELEEINEKVRKELGAIYRNMGLIPEVVYDSDSPLWFRGLVQWDEKAYMSRVNQILSNLEANHIVVGHTVRQDVIVGNPEAGMSRFNGKVWGIDTGISDFYGGFLSALMIYEGNFQVWRVKKHEYSKN